MKDAVAETSDSCAGVAERAGNDAGNAAPSYYCIARRGCRGRDGAQNTLLNGAK